MEGLSRETRGQTADARGARKAPSARHVPLVGSGDTHGDAVSLPRGPASRELCETCRNVVGDPDWIAEDGPCGEAEHRQAGHEMVLPFEIGRKCLLGLTRTEAVDLDASPGVGVAEVWVEWSRGAFDEHRRLSSEVPEADLVETLVEPGLGDGAGRSGADRPAGKRSTKGRRKWRCPEGVEHLSPPVLGSAGFEAQGRLDEELDDGEGMSAGQISNGVGRRRHR